MKDTRTKLLKTAARLFAQKGFAGASVRQISTAAKTNVAAVNYHFGDKRALYLATVQYLVEENKNWMRSAPNPLQIPENIEKLGYQEALELFQRIIDKMLDLNLSRKNILLNRIFARAEMENSQEMAQILLAYVSNFGENFFGILCYLTGLEPKSSELILLSNAILRQASISEINRFAILHALKLKDFTPEVKQQIKDVVWHNTYAILKSYKQGSKKR